MTRVANVRIVALPFELQKIDLCMQWHTRMHRDPASKWFRDLCATSYRNSQNGP